MKRRMGPIWAWIIIVLIGILFGTATYCIDHNILFSLLIGISTPVIYTILRLVLK